MASRGAREGNNALIKDTNEVIGRYDAEEIIIYEIKNNCSCEIYDLLCEKQLYPCQSSHFYNNISQCIQAGHRKFAVRIIDSMENISYYGFKKLHHEIAPIHCVAINPNSKYLKQLLLIVPERNIKDKYERRPIHFAAVCEGSEPLEYLLSRYEKETC
ncbi:unnamed protein product [Rotaria sp. Silwood2]|nr:unnamed protein product [Rotaria sp. Silwood2]